MKRSRVALSTFVVALTLVFSFGLAQEGDAGALEVVEGVVQQFEDAVSQQDGAAMAQLHTEDAKNFTEGNVDEGREAIQQGFQGAFDAGWSVSSVEVTGAGLMGDTAYGEGTYANESAEGESFGTGSWIAIYKQEGGEWKIHRLMSTSDPAPEGTATGGTMTGGGN